MNKIDYMPRRIIGYDGASYRSQLLGEKPYDIFPVITLVLYYGTTRWDEPISLFEELGHSSLHPVAAVDQNFFQEMSVPLKEGRLPENSSEILIPSGINYTCLAEGWPTWEIGQTDFERMITELEEVCEEVHYLGSYLEVV